MHRWNFFKWCTHKTANICLASVSPKKKILCLCFYFLNHRTQQETMMERKKNIFVRTSKSMQFIHGSLFCRHIKWFFMLLKCPETISENHFLVSYVSFFVPCEQSQPLLLLPVRHGVQGTLKCKFFSTRCGGFSCNYQFR